MIIFGFIKEYDKSVENAISYFDIRRDKYECDKRIISYLKSGTNMISMLHWIEDIDTKAPILPHIIRTDGFGIWPDYLSYYIEKGFQINIPELFIDHIISKNYCNETLSDSQIKKAIEFYLISIKSKVPKWKK